MEADQTQDGGPHRDVGGPPYEHDEEQREEQTVTSRPVRCEIDGLTPQNPGAVEIRQNTGQHDEGAVFP